MSNKSTETYKGMRQQQKRPQTASQIRHSNQIRMVQPKRNSNGGSSLLSLPQPCDLNKVFVKVIRLKLTSMPVIFHWIKMKSHPFLGSETSETDEKAGKLRYDYSGTLQCEVEMSYCWSEAFFHERVSIAFNYLAASNKQPINCLLKCVVKSSLGPQQPVQAWK